MDNLLNLFLSCRFEPIWISLTSSVYLVAEGGVTVKPGFIIELRSNCLQCRCWSFRSFADWTPFAPKWLMSTQSIVRKTASFISENISKRSQVLLKMSSIRVLLDF